MAKTTDLRNISEVNLTSEQKKFLAAVINTFGSMQHPFASDSTIDFFTCDYVKKTLVKKRFIKAVSEKGQALADDILKAIEDTKTNR